MCVACIKRQNDRHVLLPGLRDTAEPVLNNQSRGIVGETLQDQALAQQGQQSAA